MNHAKTVMLAVFVVICLSNPKLRVTGIIKGHLDSLRDDRTGKRSLRDLATFFILPVAVAADLCLFRGIVIDEGHLNVLLTVFSIFAALLFNFLMLIIQGKETPPANCRVDREKYRLCISQTYYNVSFATLLSVIAILLLWVISLWDSPGPLVLRTVSWITVAVILMFFAVLLMVLKRIFNIYSIDG